MENRKEFERFAALYWGQEAGIRHETAGFIMSSTICKRTEICHEWFDEIKYLQLRSIESLTDEELLKLGLILGYNPSHFKEGNAFLIKKAKGFLSLSPFEYWAVVDFLRSIRIAVPFMQYSVEDMVKMGWIKLVS